MGCCVSKDSKGSSEGTNGLNEKRESEKHTRSNVKSSKPKNKTKPVGKVKHKDQGKPLGGDVPTQNGLSPKEAAALAAEKRQEKNVNGALGKKLHQERVKSNKKHLEELSQQKLQERKETPLVFD
ncbi:hypothetical protein PP7435_CHR4-0488 [Komagataella phaffii CBS 7435]|uniref:Uncharacterized protein n=2 Tax=Komagataella phaffii TaxID=460519 RepID=C4R820_KOMPG|nr:Hypothetical protein PAS_chr4_0489 [Komagataella phaffii GS115]AOA64927.1 GQ67_04854T0 [Komagataella phaffii]CAH2450865.1 hypothetical protein BQ9382_C4-2540 [Komagataella phaffii CBS 7435]AOA69527.1 GQ68_04826T0 [Komagataella phaffii GS115]CAY71745.1 Hypothetical protein PAS_chr4_0489 [Komagataella phaffii GS115]CCA40653.1 hypothetical protein PP7435_CHR4-0488 [Komagataella phaffii CBS 7435]